jgi:hypothetical protein
MRAEVVVAEEAVAVVAEAAAAAEVVAVAAAKLAADFSDDVAGAIRRHHRDLR